MEAGSISVVIVNFAGEARLPAVFEALNLSFVRPAEILVVDDASPDGSLLWLRSQEPRVQVLAQSRNLGPSAARDRGLRAAQGDFVLFLDNDARVRPDTIGNLLQAFTDDPELTAAQPRILIAGASPPTVQCDGGYSHPTGQMALASAYLPLDQAPRDRFAITSLMSTAILVHRERAIAAGGWSPEFFMFFEDHELGARLALLGAKLSSVPDALIDHGHGTAGLSLRAGGAPSDRRVLLQTRNRWLSLLRTWSGSTMFRLSPLLVVHEIAQATFWTIRRQGGAYVQGLLSAGGLLSRTLRARANIQAHRRVADRKLLKTGPLPLHPGAVPAGRLSRWLTLGVAAGLEWLAQGLYGEAEPERASSAKRR